MKTCSKCTIEKPLDNFGKQTIKGKEYTRAVCNECRKAHSKQWYAQLPPERKIKHQDRESKRRWTWKKQGIDPDLAESYYQSHNGLCEICNESSNGKALAIDHCHITGKIRGMLCTNCNFMIGNAKDSQRILINAIDYLNKHRPDSVKVE